VTLYELQAEHAVWVAHNFPHAQPHEPLLGLVEEVGELAHAHLKHEQGIRGYDDDRYHQEGEDCIGDIMIYLASYCNKNGFDLQDCLDHTWERVSERDWQADPQKGGV
jgi:NTP pyrophosphatase (non-canonical NTP hydrolase)